jgi:hypothetical protein
MRFDVGMQEQVNKKRAPVTYRFDSSRQPALGHEVEIAVRPAYQEPRGSGGSCGVISMDFDPISNAYLGTSSRSRETSRYCIAPSSFDSTTIQTEKFDIVRGFFFTVPGAYQIFFVQGEARRQLQSALGMLAISMSCPDVPWTLTLWSDFWRIRRFDRKNYRI